MTCAFAHDDAAYVLGALSPVERLDFERHLPDCDGCTRAVRELAGLPGLLGRVDASVLEDLPADQPVPETLLPALSREVCRGRRRRRLAAAGLAAASVVLAVTLVVSQTGDRDKAAPEQAGVAQTMDPVGDVPVRASLVLEQVTWGTRIGLSCTYDPESVKFELPLTTDYVLFVRTRDGRAEQVGSWRSVAGRTMQLSAASAATLDEIVSVEVRTPDGRVVLTLAA
ncbi:MAG: anti-sigma factor family protein [Nocardioidaceae bacterium]